MLCCQGILVSMRWLCVCVCVVDVLHDAQVACGARHSAALTSDGQLFCWGWDAYGAVTGVDRTDEHVASSSKDTRVCAVPTLVHEGRCVDVAAGGWHTHVLMECG